jgi:hypothetical protein
MYVRFIRASDADNAWLATGVVTTARVLRDEGQLEDYEGAVVESAFEWFNEHLPCPPFRENLELGNWSPDAVAWFIDTAKEPVSRMWDLVWILREHGEPVRVLRTEHPGMIVYRDPFQVVAETPRGTST